MPRAVLCTAALQLARCMPTQCHTTVVLQGILELVAQVATSSYCSCTQHASLPYSVQRWRSVLSGDPSSEPGQVAPTTIAGSQVPCRARMDRQHHLASICSHAMPCHAAPSTASTTCCVEQVVRQGFHKSIMTQLNSRNATAMRQLTKGREHVRPPGRQAVLATCWRR
jgi:hypothetical protein